MLTPDQQQLFSQVVGQIGPDYTSSLQQFVQPTSPEQMQETFQQSYVQPAMQVYEQQILPAIQQRYADLGAGSSSALNQALARSASDLSTSLGSQYGQYQQGQQQQQLQALNMLQSMLTGQTFTPIIQQQPGILGSLIGAGGQIGAGYMMSSRKTKENLKDYKKGLDDLRKLDVKQYDYREEFGGDKDRVGFIAEDLPKEMTAERNNILHADVYGLVGLVVNAVKQLDKQIQELKEAS